MLALEVPTTLASLHPVASCFPYPLSLAIKRAGAEEGGEGIQYVWYRKLTALWPRTIAYDNVCTAVIIMCNYSSLWLSQCKHAASDRCLFDKGAMKKNLLLTITVMQTWSVSHSFVVILDLLILVEEFVSQPGLHCQVCFERTCVFISGYILFYFLCTNIYMLLCNFALKVLTLFSLSSPYHLFQCLSGNVYVYIPSAQNIAIKHFYCVSNAVPSLWHNYKAFIKMKCCVSILWLS